MASTLLSSPAISMTAVAPVKTSVVGVRPLEVCKAPSSSTRSKKSKSASTTKAMLVWPNKDNIKFETLSYLPSLTQEQLSKEIDYLLRNKWVPCLEFDEEGVISRKYGATPGYYDGRYWTMWKLPMFGCNDSALVLREIEEVKKAYPKAFVRCIGFDNNRQVQCISFIVHKPY